MSSDPIYCIDVTADPSTCFDEPDSWHALSSGNPFRGTAWLQSWWETWGEGRRAYVVSARRPDGSLAALLPLYRLESRGTVSLVSMGNGIVCTDHVSLLAETKEESIVVGAAIGSWLAHNAASPQDGWDFLHLDGVIAGDPALAAVGQGLRQGGSSLHACSRMNVWYLPVGETSWSDYLSKLGRNDRRKMRQRATAIERKPGLELIVPETAAAVRQRLDDIIDLHQRRWNAQAEPGTFSDPNVCRFIHRACQALFARGELRLPTLCYQGQPIAGEIQVLGRNGVLYCYAAGMDTTFADLEPGRIMHAETLKYAHSCQLAGVDMMRGDEPYKARLKCQPFPLLQLRAVAPRILPRLQQAAWRAGFEVKQWMRRSTGRTPLATFDMGAAASSPLVIS